MNNMTDIKDSQELLAISGGISLTGSFINALATGAKIILELGRSVGSAIRRTITGDYCD